MNHENSRALFQRAQSLLPVLSEVNHRILVNFVNFAFGQRGVSGGVKLGHVVRIFRKQKPDLLATKEWVFLGKLW